MASVAYSTMRLAGGTDVRDDRGVDKNPCLAYASRPEDETNPPVGRLESRRTKRRWSSEGEMVVFPGE